MTRLFKPRPYQEEATKFILRNPRANLHIEPGLGKTAIVLNAIDAMIAAGFKGKILVLGPLRVARSVWIEEKNKWGHLSYLRIVSVTGTREERLAALQEEADIFCCNYENLQWLVNQVGDKWPFRGIVADESTHFKSHRSSFVTNEHGTCFLRCTGGARAKSIARLAFTKTLYFWNLSGTPVSNGLADLWGCQFFIDKGEALGRSYTAFENRWYRRGNSRFDRYSLTLFDHSEKEIREAIAPTTFTLRAKDYLDLGEEITNTIFVDLPPAARKLYNEMEKELYIEIKAGSVEVFTLADRSNKLHQMCNGAIIYERKGAFEKLHDAKIEALKSVIEEAAGMPVIVVYQFRADLERLEEAFPKGRKFDTKKKTEDDFKKGLIPILFLHPASAAYGIDGFQYVTNIIAFFSVDWNLGQRQQTIARIGAVRQFQAGFKRPVFVHQIICRSSVDEDILERIQTKKTVAEVLSDGLARRNLT